MLFIGLKAHEDWSGFFYPLFWSHLKWIMQFAGLEALHWVTESYYSLSSWQILGMSARGTYFSLFSKFKL